MSCCLNSLNGGFIKGIIYGVSGSAVDRQDQGGAAKRRPKQRREDRSSHGLHLCRRRL